MANTVLFISSLFGAFIHALAQCKYRQRNIILSLTIIYGILTSIWNHYTTSPIAQFADRSMMTIGFISNCYSIYNLEDDNYRLISSFMLLSAALLYASSKYISTYYSSSFTDLPHLIAHGALTSTHVLLMCMNANC